MTTNDINQDEVRRQLRDVDAMNDRAMPAWRALLDRIVGGDPSISTDEKAAVLGVPTTTRRTLFKFGGATIIGAAVLAACGSDKEPATTAASTAAPTTGASATTMAPATTRSPATTMGPATTMAPASSMPDSSSQDLVLARTAASLEKLAIDVYATAAALLTTPAIKDAATMFAGHHQQHMDALNGVITKAGGKAVTEQNKAVYDALIAPALAAAKTEGDAVKLATMLEEAAAQTYVFAGGALSTPALRSTIMTIGGVEARHAAVLHIAGMAQTYKEVFPDDRAFFPGDNPLAGINGALITT